MDLIIDFITDKTFAYLLTLCSLVFAFIYEFGNNIRSNCSAFLKVVNSLRVVCLYGVFTYLYVGHVLPGIHYKFFEISSSEIYADILFSLIICVIYQLSILPSNILKCIFIKGYLKEYVNEHCYDLMIYVCMCVGLIYAVVLIPMDFIALIAGVFIFIPIIYDILKRRKILSVQLMLSSAVFGVVLVGLIIFSNFIIYSNKLAVSMGFVENSYAASIGGFIMITRPFFLLYDSIVNRFKKIVSGLYVYSNNAYNIDSESVVSTDESEIDKGVYEVLELGKTFVLKRYEDYMEMKQSGGNFNYKVSYHGSVYDYEGFEEHVKEHVSELLKSDKEINNYIITIRTSKNCDDMERLSEDIILIIKDIVKKIGKNDLNLYIECDSNLQYGEFYADIILQLYEKEEVSDENDKSDK